jgi:hypothetical protein
VNATEKILTFDMLAESEKETCMRLLEKLKKARAQKSDEQLADEYYERAGNLGRAILTVGTSAIKNRALSLFYAFRSTGDLPGGKRSNIIKREFKLISYLHELRPKYGCDSLGLDTFPGYDNY